MAPPETQTAAETFDGFLRDEAPWRILRATLRHAFTRERERTVLAERWERFGGHAVRTAESLGITTSRLLRLRAAAGLITPTPRRRAPASLR